MSLWLFPWVGGGGTKEPVMTHGAPEAGRDVGLMYSLSSPSDDSFSPLDTADPGSDLSKGRRHRAFFFSWVVNDKFEKSWSRHKTQTHWQTVFFTSSGNVWKASFWQIRTLMWIYMTSPKQMLRMQLARSIAVFSESCLEERWKNIHSLLISSCLTTLFPVYYTSMQQSSVPRSQAVDGIDRRLRFAPLCAGSVALRDGRRGQRGLCCRTRHHVVGCPCRLVWGGGEGSPLESGFLADQGGALRWGRRGQLSQCWRQR